MCSPTGAHSHSRWHILDGFVRELHSQPVERLEIETWVQLLYAVLDFLLDVLCSSDARGKGGGDMFGIENPDLRNACTQLTASCWTIDQTISAYGSSVSSPLSAPQAQAPPTQICAKRPRQSGIFLNEIKTPRLPLLIDRLCSSVSPSLRHHTTLRFARNADTALTASCLILTLPCWMKAHFWSRLISFTRAMCEAGTPSEPCWAQTAGAHTHAHAQRDCANRKHTQLTASCLIISLPCWMKAHFWSRLISFMRAMWAGGTPREPCGCKWPDRRRGI